MGTASSNPWLDPRNITAIVGVSVGIAGLLFGILRDRWSRRESRMDALSKILDPMIRSAQYLKRANTARRTCERLKQAFPNPSATPEAAQRANSLVDEYAKLMESSETEFRNTEAEFAARLFRFPEKVRRLIKATFGTLGGFARLVNDGHFDKADLELAKFRDDYKRLSDTARGWRLADPLEGLKMRLRKKKIDDTRSSEFELTEEEMNGVFEILHKRVTTQGHNSFVVHPPKVVIDDPDILKSDQVIDALKDSVFSIVFQDGTAKLVSLPELMALVYNLVFWSLQAAEVAKMMEVAKPSGPREIAVNFQFSMQDIMRPEMVKALFEKIELASTASDAP